MPRSQSKQEPTATLATLWKSHSTPQRRHKRFLVVIDAINAYIAYEYLARKQSLRGGLTFVRNARSWLLYIGFSLATAMSTWMALRDDANQPLDVWVTRGNRLTCSMEGFFVQLNVAMRMYNASLCFYFPLILKYNMTDQALSARVEHGCMHFLS